MTRVLAVTLALAVAGCNPKPTMAVGGITIGAGVLIAVTPDDCTGFCLISNEDFGTAVAVVGLVIFGIGLLGLASESSQPKIVAPTNAPPAPFQPTAEPDFTQVGPPGLAPVVEPKRDEPPLPANELTFVNPSDRQFALQASSAARRGNCAAAVASGQKLSVDLRHQLAHVDAAYSRCVQTQP